MLKVSDFDHIPVLLYQTVDALNVRPGGIYVDCTAEATVPRSRAE